MLINNLKNTIWKKLSQLKVGSKIAIENKGKLAFDEIVSIKALGKQRVYDIEVEGSHNFVGGHYLNINQEEEKLLTLFNREFSKENKHQKSSNQNQSQSDIYSGSKIGQINHILSSISSSLTAVNANNATKTNSAINIGSSLTPNISSNAPAEISEKIDDNTLSWLRRNLKETGIKLSLKQAINIVKQYQQGQVQYGGILAHNTYISGTATADSFYDAQSTSYYLDPANTSKSLVVAGNVGIGTTGPGYKLEVSGTSQFDNAVYFANGTTYYVDASGNAKFLDLIAANTGNPALTVGSTTTGYISLGGSQVSSASNIITFDDSNWTGSELNISDSTAANQVLLNTSGTYIRFGDHVVPHINTTYALGVDGTAWVSVAAGIYYDSSGSTYYLDPASTSNLNALKTNGGFEFIGGANNVGTIYTDSNWGGLIRGRSGAIADVALQNSAGTVILSVTGTQVGIYDSTPSYGLDVFGTIRGYGITDSSDIRLKKNVAKLSPVLDRVNQLRAINYNWINEATFGSGLQIGFVAQEVETLFPELVSTDNDGYKSIAYGKMTAVLASAIQELNIKLIALSANLKTNAIETKTLIADSITLQGQSLKAYITSVVNEVLASNNTKILSPVAGIDQLTVKTATVSGELVAGSIKSSTIDIMRQRIEDITARINQTAAAAIVPDSSTIDVNTLNTLYELLNAKNEATASAQSINIASIEASFGFFKDYLAVLGKAAITDLSVTNTLTTASINSPTGSLSLLAGVMILDQSGNVAINGNLTVNGEVLAQKVTAPQGHFDELLSQKLEVDEARIKSLTTDNLIIAGDASASAQTATSSASITTNATAGKAVLPKNTTEFTINTPKINADSLIYVTPIGDSQNQVLYVKAKQVGAWFKVAINQPLDHDLEFNWWIIKLEGEKAI